MADELRLEAFALHNDGHERIVLAFLAYLAEDDTREASIDLDDLVEMVNVNRQWATRAEIEKIIRALEGHGQIVRLPDMGRVTIQIGDRHGLEVAAIDRYHYAFPSPIPEARP